MPLDTYLKRDAPQPQTHEAGGDICVRFNGGCAPKQTVSCVALPAAQGEGGTKPQPEPGQVHLSLTSSLFLLFTPPPPPCASKLLLTSAAPPPPDDMGNLRVCGCTHHFYQENLGHTEGVAELEGTAPSRGGLEETSDQGKPPEKKI